MSELAKWAEARPKFEAITGFLDHLEEEFNLGLSFDEAKPGTPLDRRMLIMQYLGIDIAQLDQERRALLERQVGK